MEGWDVFISLSCDVALLAVTLLLNSELVEATETELWAADNIGAGDESAAVMDPEDEVVG